MDLGVLSDVFDPMHRLLISVAMGLFKRHGPGKPTVKKANCPSEKNGDPKQKKDMLSIVKHRPP